ncbi:MAG: hypothetical protein R3E95_06925 [Thiolinea sp.]
MAASANDDGISPLLGLGAQYQLTPNTAVRGEWEHTFNTGADSDYEADTNNYSNWSVVFDLVGIIS